MPLSDVQIHDGVLGLAVPAGIGFLGAVLGLWFGARAAKRSDSARPASRLSVLGPVLGFGIGYIFTIVVIQGLPAGGLLARSASHIQSLVVGAALVLAIVDTFQFGRKKGAAARWLGRAILVALVLVLQLRSAREYQWSAGLGQVLWTGGIGLWMLGSFAAFDATFSRTNSAAAVLPIGIFTVFSIPAIFDASATAQWQIALGVAMTLFGVAGAGLIFQNQRLQPPFGTVVVPWLSGVVVLAYLYSEMPLWRAATIAAAPLAISAPDVLWPRMCRHRRLAIRSGIAAALGLAVSYSAFPGFAENFFGA